MSWAYDVSLACRFTVGTVFAVSFITKVFGRAAWQSFRSWLARLPLPYVQKKGTSFAVAAAEAIVVALTTVSVTAAEGLAVSAVLGATLTAGLVISLRRGSREPCHCFGSSSDPLSWQHVARNVLLLVVALTGAFCSLAHATANPASAVVMAAFAGLAVALCIIFFADIIALFRPGPAMGTRANPNPSRAHLNPR